jgi:hypothetical protein
MDRIGGDGKRTFPEFPLSRVRAAGVAPDGDYACAICDEGPRSRKAKAGSAADDDERLCAEGRVFSIQCSVFSIQPATRLTLYVSLLFL